MISLGHFNWPIEAAVFNKNHYWASREYADRFWPLEARIELPGFMLT